MSTSTHPIIILSDSYIKDAFSSTNTPDYTPASPDYFPASPGNTFSDPLEDLSKDLLASLAISPFQDNPYMKVMQAYNATNDELTIPSPRAPIALLTILPLSPKRAHFLSPFSTDSSIPPQRDFDQLETELQEACTQIYGFQRKHDDEIVLTHVRTSTLEILIKDIQIRHRSDMKNLLDKIHKLKNHKGGPPNY
ncbi:hypothetical protein Tco_1065027 [Tanacetum coccineum]